MWQIQTGFYGYKIECGIGATRVECLRLQPIFDRYTDISRISGVESTQFFHLVGWGANKSDVFACHSRRESLEPPMDSSIVCRAVKVLLQHVCTEFMRRVARARELARFPVRVRPVPAARHKKSREKTQTHTPRLSRRRGDNNRRYFFFFFCLFYSRPRAQRARGSSPPVTFKVCQYNRAQEYNARTFIIHSHVLLFLLYVRII